MADFYTNRCSGPVCAVSRKTAPTAAVRGNNGVPMARRWGAVPRGPGGSTASNWCSRRRWACYPTRRRWCLRRRTSARSRRRCSCAAARRGRPQFQPLHVAELACGARCRGSCGHRPASTTARGRAGPHREDVPAARAQSGRDVDRTAQRRAGPRKGIAPGRGGACAPVWRASWPPIPLVAILFIQISTVETSMCTTRLRHLWGTVATRANKETRQDATLHPAGSLPRSESSVWSGGWPAQRGLKPLSGLPRITGPRRFIAARAMINTRTAKGSTMRRMFSGCISFDLRG